MTSLLLLLYKVQCSVPWSCKQLVSHSHSSISVHSGKSQRQGGDHRGLKWLWRWQTWLLGGTCECFTSCWSTEIFRTSQSSLGFTANHLKNRKYPLSSSFAVEDWGQRSEWPDWLGSAELNHPLQRRSPGLHRAQSLTLLPHVVSQKNVHQLLNAHRRLLPFLFLLSPGSADFDP